MARFWSYLVVLFFGGSASSSDGAPVGDNGDGTGAVGAVGAVARSDSAGVVRSASAGGVGAYMHEVRGFHLFEQALPRGEGVLPSARFALLPNITVLELYACRIKSLKGLISLILILI